MIFFDDVEGAVVAEVVGSAAIGAAPLMGGDFGAVIFLQEVSAATTGEVAPDGMGRDESGVPFPAFPVKGRVMESEGAVFLVNSSQAMTPGESLNLGAIDEVGDVPGGPSSRLGKFDLVAKLVEVVKPTEQNADVVMDAGTVGWLGDFGAMAGIANLARLKRDVANREIGWCRVESFDFLELDHGGQGEVDRVGAAGRPVGHLMSSASRSRAPARKAVRPTPWGVWEIGRTGVPGRWGFFGGCGFGVTGQGLM